MSDIYVVLRSRLEKVASWINLGTEAMEGAQRRLGLSDERVAREIPVSTRTWIRWRQRGQVPVQWLPNVAKVLDLELEQAQRVRVHVNGDESEPTSDDQIAALREEVAGMRAMVEELLRRGA
ncbi:MAG TPA: hypothetical protein VNM39_04590 [Verrucomicrobiae bacterium]|nr:hypothetical protein [Verrucomicrobiae bacterium]